MITAIEAEERYGMDRRSWARLARRGDVRGEVVQGGIGGKRVMLLEADCARYVSEEGKKERARRKQERAAEKSDWCYRATDVPVVYAEHREARCVPRHILGALYVYARAVELGVPLPTGDNTVYNAIARAGAQIRVVETEAEAEAIRVMQGVAI